MLFYNPRGTYSSTQTPGKKQIRFSLIEETNVCHYRVALQHLSSNLTHFHLDELPRRERSLSDIWSCYGRPVHNLQSRSHSTAIDYTDLDSESFLLEPSSKIRFF